MAENKPKTPRKPRTKKEVNNEVTEQAGKPLVNEEELLKDPNMKSEDPEASLAETVAANPEIMENQGIPSADEVAELAKEAENSLEIAEKPEDLAEKEKESAEKEEESAGELASEAIPETGTELPKDVPAFEDFSAPAAGGPAYLKKLNPYLDDGQSKWVAQVSDGALTHKIFKGSYVRAFNAAKNYNTVHGFVNAEIKKVRI